MRPPDEDDQSGGEQELAQVIPLRRRTHEQDETAEISSITPHGHTPTAVFDPPADPEPPEEYSVWEQPIAELIRRSEPEPRRKRRHRTTGHSTRPRVLLALGVLAVLSGVLALAFSGWLSAPRYRPEHTRVSANASVQETPATSSQRSHAHNGAQAQHESRSSGDGGHHTRAASTAGSSGAASQAEAQGQSTGPQGSTGTATGASGEAAASSERPPAQLAAVSAQEAAAREFGFER